MEAQQIREGLDYLIQGDEVLLVPITLDLEVAHGHWLEVSQAALEYADLIETSKRIWWCSLDGKGNADGRQDWCLQNLEDEDHSGCGWRLLGKVED